ncbi:MAG: hypothetical protein H6686_04755 [Fibrobacteria bacterium]|nr:hypothetical protein [Fibrobacteria bacterium]
MNSTAVRSTMALGLAAILLGACSDVMSALNIFLVKFFYGGGGLASLILPQEIRYAATAYSNPTSVAGLNAISELVKRGISTTPSGLLAHFKDPNLYGMNLAFGLGADNSGNNDKASFPAAAGLNLFVQERSNANKITTGLQPFSVAGGKVDTIPVSIPVTLAALPSSTFQSMLKGDAIPYWVSGSLGFELKSPTGEVLSTHNTEMDLATENIETRPDDQTVKSFLTLVANAF